MKGVRKEFEEDLYNKYDGPAKHAMQVHLELSGHDVTVPPENYGVDLYSTIGDLVMYHEVEVSEGWKSGIHPFPKGSIPERKIRLKAMQSGDPLYFWMLRFDLRRAVVFGSHLLQDRFLVEVPNRKVPEGEYFYRIPKHLGKEFDLLPIQPDVFADIWTIEEI
jgi:hypothetical protein